MFVLNFKLDYRKILIAFVVIALIVATIIGFGSNKTSSVATNDATNFDYVLTDENFTEMLKNIHENIDANLNKTVSLTGFVFRMPDFKDGYFVCGRNTIVDTQDKVAGFLCQSDEESKLLDNEWVEITGVIIKGEYNGEMPIIKVGSIKKVVAPANTFVKNTPKT